MNTAHRKGRISHPSGTRRLGRRGAIFGPISGMKSPPYSSLLALAASTAVLHAGSPSPEIKAATEEYWTRFQRLLTPVASAVDDWWPHAPSGRGVIAVASAD